jgi:hypothetical protein
MEDLQLKLNTLNSLIPAKMPYVLGQVNEAVKLAENSEGFERNLDIAIEIAEQLAHFYKDDMLMYNYKPIVIALLLNVAEDADLSAFDTIGHEIPVGLATVRQFLKVYPLKTKEYATEFPKFLGMSDVATVILTNLKADVKENKNLINIGYILLANNQTANNVVNEVRTLYYDLKAEVREKQF